ncbi:MAG TPA: protocatechuate 3,4-dioxygenase subunit alpha [Solirubrobacteraceae bacterium]
MPTTPSQTVGPFFAIELPYGDGRYVVPKGTTGAVWLRGRVLDGDGAPVPDALVESWQADPGGRFGGDFRGFGRASTDDEGRWAILTLKPGPIPGGSDGTPQAPHIDLAIFARGLLHQVVTRLYFGDEAQANAADPVLAGLDEQARATLVAQRCADGYELDIHLQGPHETTFFAV